MSAIVPGEDVATAVYTVAVRDLREFTAKVGSPDLRFTPVPTALQGMLGHQTVAQRRGPEHETEVKLSGQFQTLRMAGRCDGYNPQRNELEEIKTHGSTTDTEALIRVSPVDCFRHSAADPAWQVDLLGFARPV